MQMSDATTPAPQTKAPRPKKNYMLHDPSSMKPIGRFSSPTPRGAAMKAASRGHTNILLRETGTKMIHKYTGQKVTLEKPREVNRNGKIIRYEHASVVKSEGKPYVYGGDVDETAEVPSEPKA
jgi:hypothetical protein